MIVWILKGSVRYNEVSPITPNGPVGPRTFLFLKFVRAHRQPNLNLNLYFALPNTKMLSEKHGQQTRI